METNDTVTLRIPRDSAPAVRDLMRAHLTELPEGIRNDVNTQLANWPGGSHVSAGAQGDGGGQASTTSRR